MIRSFVSTLPLLAVAAMAGPVCMPLQMEFDFYDSLTQSSHHGAADYRLGLAVKVTPDYRLIHDFFHATWYNITSSGCVKRPVTPGFPVPTRCLPDSAVKTGETTLGMDLKIEIYNAWMHD